MIFKILLLGFISCLGFSILFGKFAAGFSWRYCIGVACGFFAFLCVLGGLTYWIFIGY